MTAGNEEMSVEHNPRNSAKFSMSVQNSTSQFSPDACEFRTCSANVTAACLIRHFQWTAGNVSTVNLCWLLDCQPSKNAWWLPPWNGFNARIRTMSFSNNEGIKKNRSDGLPERAFVHLTYFFAKTQLYWWPLL